MSIIQLKELIKSGHNVTGVEVVETGVSFHLDGCEPILIPGLKTGVCDECCFLLAELMSLCFPRTDCERYWYEMLCGSCSAYPENFIGNIVIE